MKRILTIALAILLAIPAPARAASALPRAFAPMEPAAYALAYGFEQQASSDVWHLRSDNAQKLHRSVAEGALSAYASTGALALYVELEGSEAFGHYGPVLCGLFVGPDLKAEAISLRSGDERLDFIAHAQTVELTGSRKAQRISAPLTPESLAWLAEASGRDQLDVRIHGSKGYVTHIERKPAYANAKRRLEADGLDCLALDPAIQPEFAGYCAWDIASAYWQARTGLEPRCQILRLSDEPPPEGEDVPALDELMGMLSPGAPGREVRKLQAALIERGALYGRADGGYGQQTREAVKLVQSQLGLLPTGSADARLLRALFSFDSGLEEPVEKPAEQGAAIALADLAQIAIGRYWTAKAVRPENAPMTGADIPCAEDSGNRLLIADGQIVNLSPEKLNLGRVQARLVCDGRYTYPAAVRCQADEGARFERNLLPQARSRLVVYAEAPASALDGGEWTLEIQIKGAMARYALSKSD